MSVTITVSAGSLARWHRRWVERITPGLLAKAGGGALQALVGIFGLHLHGQVVCLFILQRALQRSGVDRLAGIGQIIHRFDSQADFILRHGVKVKPFAHIADGFGIRRQLLRSESRKIDPHFGTTDHHRFGDVVARVSDKNNLQPFQPPENLFHCHEVGQNLRRVEFIGQTVVDRHSGSGSQQFDMILPKAAELNRVEHPSQNAGGILHRLLCAQLNVVG